MEKEFVFEVVRAKKVLERGEEQCFSISLRLTQAQFEDYQFLKDCVKARLAACGIQDDEGVHWYENPPIEDQFIEKLRLALGAATDAQFIPKYAHGWHHRTYKEIVVDGAKYLWQSFQNGHFVKFAPANAS